MKKVLFIAFIFFFIAVAVAYSYVYKDHISVAETEAMRSFTTEELISIFQDDDLENDKELLDQVIEVSGIATEKSANSITLDKTVFIDFTNSADTTNEHIIKVNQTYIIKGHCLGYDDLLEEVKIDQAILINPLK